MILLRGKSSLIVRLWVTWLLLLVRVVTIRGLRLVIRLLTFSVRLLLFVVLLVVLLLIRVLIRVRLVRLMLIW